MPKINTVRGIENRKVVSQSEWLVDRMFGPDWQQGCEHCSFWPTTSTA